MHVLVYYLHETFPTVSWCHTLFVPMAVCPKCCTNLYQEREKVPSLENASTTPIVTNLWLLSTLLVDLGTRVVWIYTGLFPILVWLSVNLSNPKILLSHSGLHAKCNEVILQ